MLQKDSWDYGACTPYIVASTRISGPREVQLKSQDFHSLGQANHAKLGVLVLLLGEDKIYPQMS